MANHPHTPAGEHHTRTTPKDFFLWVAAIITLYGSITAFFALIFEYINIAFPDPLAYAGDLYGGAARTAMATLIVFIPLMLGCLLTIRRDIVRTPSKADIWVRRWALVFTIFLASATAAITLITLVYSFLGGEITMRFALKALVVLLIAILAALHFLADLRGYWTLHRNKANMIGAAVGALAILTIVVGFFIIGTPKEIRSIRTDQERIGDLQNLQGNITEYWRQKRELPASLNDLADPLYGTSVPVDPVTNQPYEYTAESATSFTLCAIFSAVSKDTGSQTIYSSYGTPMQSDSFMHGEGRTCFTRTIDPDKYPPLTANPA